MQGREGDAEDDRPGRVALHDLLPQVDVLSLHCPLTETNRGMIGADELALMKKDAVLINTARGGLVDEEALFDVLENRLIGGAGLDVLEQEPPDLNNPLLHMENVIVTGHAAGTSVEGVQDWQDEWRQIITAFIAGYWPINVVNPTVQPKIPLKRNLGTSIK